jgi:hypothetical protein
MKSKIITRSLLVTSISLVLVTATADQGPATGSTTRQPRLNSYIAIMELQPAIAYDGGLAGFEATRPGRGKKINPASAKVTRYTDFLERSHDDVLAASGVRLQNKTYSYTYALNGLAAWLTEDQAEALARQPGVVMVRRDTLRHKATESTAVFLGLTNSEDGGVWARGYTGEGVVVGVIDSGIWPEHPSFHGDGSYGIATLMMEDVIDHPACDFGNTAWNPDDAPFACNNKLIGARTYLDTYRAFIGLTPDEFDSARDSDGHGTHNASVAAGNADVDASIFGISRGRVSGIAPRARIIAYKALGELGGFSSDLAAAIDRAVADGVDVINYSIGGGASLMGAEEVALLFAADASVLVATSAGNAGPGPGTVGGPASVPWVTAVGATTHDRAYISDITLTGPGAPPAGLWGASVTTGISGYDLVDADAVAGGTNGRCLDPFPAGTFQATDVVLCNEFNYGVTPAERVANVAAGGGGAVILHNVETVNTLPAQNHVLPAVQMPYDVGVPLKSYLVANPGQVGISFTQGRARDAADDPRVVPLILSSFSSRGPDPVAQDIIKPDLTAPGVGILAGASPIHTGAQAQGQLFQVMTGTSSCSAHTAGVYALIRQAHPDWSPAMAKSALMTTADRGVLREDGVTAASPFDMGAGNIDPADNAGRGSALQPGLVYDAGFIEYLGFLCDEEPDVFADPAGTCATLESLGVPVEAHDLNLPSIGVAEVPGAWTVHRTVTSVATERGRRRYTVSVDAPPGFTVSVSPSTIQLRSGETAEYQVTFTNFGAPIGEWRFGGLTWTDRTGKYEVYSPIAVRGSLFTAPTEISDSGASGTGSFEVHFGYTGDYSAAAHGLETPTIIGDNVVQDPDQNFNPLDGFSNAHMFSLSGAAYLRVKLPPDSASGGADLDLYVYDPSGSLVGSSTQFGTDEQIDIPFPMDGTWTVYVHGWSTPGGSADYDLYAWVISATPGGNLSIDSAPASAVLGSPGTIDYSWSGATAGMWWLGAISHTGDAGVIGLTLVEVDNR